MGSPRSRLVGLASLALLTGCELDERAMLGPRIRAIDLGGAGEHSTPQAPFAECGEGGAAGVPEAVGCWAFDHDTQGWQEDPGIALSFSRDDAASDAHSGSLAVTNTDVERNEQLFVAGATQCLPVSLLVAYQSSYRLDLAVLVPFQGTTGGASVLVEFINTPVCQGIILGHTQLDSNRNGVWQRLAQSGEVPEGTSSVAIHLLVDKVHSEPRFEASFDQIRLEFW